MTPIQFKKSVKIIFSPQRVVFQKASPESKPVEGSSESKIAEQARQQAVEDLISNKISPEKLVDTAKAKVDTLTPDPALREKAKKQIDDNASEFAKAKAYISLKTKLDTAITGIDSKAADSEFNSKITIANTALDALVTDPFQSPAKTAFITKSRADLGQKTADNFIVKINKPNFNAASQDFKSGLLALSTLQKLRIDPKAADGEAKAKIDTQVKNILDWMGKNQNLLQADSATQESYNLMVKASHNFDVATEAGGWKAGAREYLQMSAAETEATQALGSLSEAWNPQIAEGLKAANPQKGLKPLNDWDGGGAKEAAIAALDAYKQGNKYKANQNPGDLVLGLKNFNAARDGFQKLKSMQTTLESKNTTEEQKTPAEIAGKKVEARIASTPNDKFKAYLEATFRERLNYIKTNYFDKQDYQQAKAAYDSLLDTKEQITIGNAENKFSALKSGAITEVGRAVNDFGDDDDTDLLLSKVNGYLNDGRWRPSDVTTALMDCVSGESTAYYTSALGTDGIIYFNYKFINGSPHCYIDKITDRKGLEIRRSEKPTDRDPKAKI